METKVEDYKLEEAMYRRLKYYLETRLGSELRFARKTEKNEDNTARVTLETKTMSGSGKLIGLFAAIIKTFTIKVTLNIDKDKKRYKAITNFYYEHHDGGTNGHEISFGLLGSLDGSQLEEYTWR